MALPSKRYNLDDQKVVDEVHKMLFDESEDEDDFDDDDDDTDTQDHLDIRSENSDSEQDISEASNDDECGETNDAEHGKTSDSEYFMGKDKTTKWSKFPSNKPITSKPHILKRKTSVINEAKKARTALECFSCLISDDILNIIVQFTNQHIDEIKTSFTRDRDAKHTDIIEIKAFIGLLILAGIHRSNRQILSEIWGADGDGIEKFRLVMNLRRFKFLTRCIRFDDRNTQEKRRKTDKLAAIRDIFTIFVKNCQNCYNIGENVTIDKKLESLRGRCCFRQYIRNKPNKYGLKIYALVDSKVFYLYNLEIYAGTQPAGEFQLSNKPADVVMRLCQPIFGSGRNVTANNYFTSIQLVEELKRQKLSYVGTVNKNKQELPQQFVNKKRPIYSSLFGFQKNVTLLSYTPKSNKTVLLVSSLHHDDAIDGETGEALKPTIVTFYNKTRGGVDTTAKLCASYNVARNVKRWPLVIFFAMLNMAGINAQIISFENNRKVTRRRVFLKQLSNELVLPQLACRSSNMNGMHIELQQRLKRYLPTAEVANDDPSTADGKKRKRCVKCVGSRRLTKYNCRRCKGPVCLSHMVPFCSDCCEIERVSEDSLFED